MNFLNETQFKLGVGLKTNIFKGNHCILQIQSMWVCQKLGMILENKVSKIEATKNFNAKDLGSEPCWSSLEKRNPSCC